MTVRGLRSTQRKLRRIRDNLDDNVRDAAERGAARAASEARDQVITGNQVWTGNLASNIYMRKTSEGTYKIVADVPYAAFVEFGTGARSDPSAPPRFQFGSPEHTPELTRQIKEWVATKPGFFGPRTPEVAWAIARTISQIGTNAHPFLRPAWFTAKPLLLQDVQTAVKRTISRA